MSCDCTDFLYFSSCLSLTRLFFSCVVLIFFLNQSFPTFWSPSDTPLYNLEPCDPLPFDVARFRGLTASTLLDLTYLTGIHEDPGKVGAKRHEKKHRHESEEKGEAEQKGEAEAAAEEKSGGNITAKSENDPTNAVGDGGGGGTDQHHHLMDGKRRSHDHVPRSHDIGQSEVRAVQLSYINLGAMKSLGVLLSCSKYAELLLIPKVMAENGHNSDCATSPVVHEDVEMRAALQFLMRHMVKRAVMRSPIKRALGLADLERAQAMIYKLVVHGLLEEQFGGRIRQGMYHKYERTQHLPLDRWRGLRRAVRCLGPH